MINSRIHWLTVACLLPAAAAAHRLFDVDNYPDRLDTHIPKKETQ